VVYAPLGSSNLYVSRRKNVAGKRVEERLEVGKINGGSRLRRKKRI
jgi:hypothetical protein